MAREVRLIDANALDALEDLEYIYHPVCDGDAWYRAEDVWKCIGEQPTIDPESLRLKGRWEDADDGDGVVCSVCREDFCNLIYEIERFKYCPHCGTKMEEG